MRLLSIFTILATATSFTSALPEQASAQISCIGLNDRYCDNVTVGLTCCPPLRCGSDSQLIQLVPVGWDGMALLERPTARRPPLVALDSQIVFLNKRIY
ncbi:hypothetical protein BJX65DRAFT_306594 [Aspergillus insuetus]